MVAQQRLAQPAFSRGVRAGAQVFGIDILLEAALEGLEVVVLETGEDLIRLELGLAGTLSVSGNDIALSGVARITTPFETVRTGTTYEVRARLDDEHAAIDYVDDALTDDQLAAVITAFRRWLGTERAPWVLFGFSSNLGDGAGAVLDAFQVSSAFAAFSPEYSSLVLAMGGKADARPAQARVFDPHLLPNGETAVLWVSRELLEATGGDQLVADAQRRLSFRPRPMHADVPEITEPLRAWTDTLMSEVSIPGGVEFTVLQQRDAGLMLSATPPSIEELAALRAIDHTVSDDDRVQAAAEELMRACVFHYMDADLRDAVLQKPKPALPDEVLEVSRDAEAFYRALGRLQVASAIGASDVADRKPFSRIVAERVAEKMREITTSVDYADQTSRLYGLAFCHLHPRMSLYMEHPDTWLAPYLAYLDSPEFFDEAMRAGHPARFIHEAVCKTTVFDRSGASARAAHERAMTGFAIHVSERVWPLYVMDEPQAVEDVLTTTVAALVDQAEEAAEAGGDDADDAKTVMELVDVAGSVEALVAMMMEAFRASAEHAVEKARKLAERRAARAGRRTHARRRRSHTRGPAGRHRPPDHVTALQRMSLWDKHPKRMRSGLTILQAVSAIAALTLFIVGSKDGITDDEMTDADKAKEYTSFTLGLMSVFAATGELFKAGWASLRDASPRCARWVARKSKGLATTAIARLGRVGNWAKNTGKALTSKAAGVLFGSVLCLLTIGLSIWDAVDAHHKDNIEGMWLDLGLTAVAFLELVIFGLESFAIGSSWTGPVAIGLALIGLFLVVIRTFAFPDGDPAADAVNHLVTQLEGDGVAVA